MLWANPALQSAVVHPDGDCLSQLYYCVKAEELLKPLGILALVVPQSFWPTPLRMALQSEMESRYSFRPGQPAG